MQKHGLKNNCRRHFLPPISPLSNPSFASCITSFNIRMLSPYIHLLLVYFMDIFIPQQVLLDLQERAFTRLANEYATSGETYLSRILETVFSSAVRLPLRSATLFSSSSKLYLHPSFERLQPITSRVSCLLAFHACDT